jgi:hypothetical protein
VTYGDGEVVFVAYPIGANHIERPTELAVANMMFDKPRSMALGVDESVRLIDQVEQHYRPI